MRGQTNGYDITFDASIRLLILRICGVWDVALGQRFVRDFQEQITNLPCDKTWYLLLNITHCPLQAQEVQKTLSHSMLLARNTGMKKHAIVANIPVALFPLNDPELQIDFYFQSEKDAIRWLLN